MKNIRINYVHPPIPTRSFDWCAYYEGDEEGYHCGWGETPVIALAEFLALED